MGLQVNTKEAKRKDKTKKPEITVIVATYNRAEMLREALESLICQETNDKFSFEIITVDNGSTDSTKATVQQVAANSPVPIRYILEKVQGDAPARNRGIKESQTTWIAFFDDDQLAEVNWLEQLYNAASQTKALVIGGAVRLDLPAEQLQKLSPLFRRSMRETSYSRELRKYRRRELPGTGNALYARAVFDSVGLFDSSVPGGASDYDFALRVRKAGFDMWYAPKAIIHHRVLPNRLTPQFLKWGGRKHGVLSAYLDFKHKGCSKMLFFCFARIGRAFLVTLPLLFAGWVRRNQGEILGRKGQLWATEAYTRTALFFSAPKIFRQKRFFASVEFLKGRPIEEGL